MFLKKIRYFFLVFMTAHGIIFLKNIFCNAIYTYICIYIMNRLFLLNKHTHKTKLTSSCINVGNNLHEKNFIQENLTKLINIKHPFLMQTQSL
jgi:hypothetical protein